MRQIINLTPHAIVVEAVRPRAFEDGSDGDCRVTIPSSGVVARVTEQPVSAATYRASIEVDGCQIQAIGAVEYGLVEGLPAETVGGPLYLVSALVASAVRGELRGDLLVPDTGPDSAIRDARGQIVAVRRLRFVS